jgi:hypothetical protein
MSLRTLLPIRVAALVLLGALPAAAAPSRFVHALDAMMVSLGAESARSGAQIRRAYQEHLDFLMLAGYVDMEGALDNGGLVPLPADARRFNLMPRLEGAHPIGEKDLQNQSSYIAARPATMGMLLEIASQVKSGPIEITSLVRHGEYQDSLRSTNANATTSVPMHTMGLAVDIALVNTPLKTAYEVRDVLRRMQRKGDILFIGERRQLVFHVVPHPSRLGYFTDVYIRKVGLPPTSRSAHVVATATVPAVRRTGGSPHVTSEVLSVLPLIDFEAPVAADAEPPPVAPSRVSASATVVQEAAVSAGHILRRWTLLFAALLIAGWRIAARPTVRPDLLEL